MTKCLSHLAYLSLISISIHVSAKSFYPIWKGNNYQPNYPTHYHVFNNETNTTDTFYYDDLYGDGEFGNATLNHTQEYIENYSRIRFMKLIQLNFNFTLDLQLSFPIPGFDGTFDIDIPIRIMIQNRTVLKFPYPDPPLRVPLLYPVVKLPKLPSFLSSHIHKAQGHGQDDSNNQAYDDNDEGTPYYSAQDDKYPLAAAYPFDDNYDNHISDYYNTDDHVRAKRELAAHSAQHRADIFGAIESGLEKSGYEGRPCVERAICEFSRQPFLVENVLHEMMEHLLMVSRSYDENGLLTPYLAAEKLGQSSQGDVDQCSKRYSCSFSLFTQLLSF